MKNLITEIMYNLYVLNIIRKNKRIEEYIKKIKKEHDEQMVYKLRMKILSEVENL